MTTVIFSGSLKGQNTDSISQKTNFFLKLHENRERSLKQHTAEKLQRQADKKKWYQTHNTTKLNIIKTEPLLYLTGVINASYERKLGKSISIESRIDYIFKLHLLDYDYCSGYIPYELVALPSNGFAVSLGLKFFKKEYDGGLSGVYFNPQLTYKYNLSSKNTFNHYYETYEGQKELSIIGIKLIWGRQYFYSNNFSIDMYLGVGARYINSNTTIFYRKAYLYIDECQCDKNEFTEDFTIRTSKNEMILPSFHIGIKIGLAF